MAAAPSLPAGRPAPGVLDVRAVNSFLLASISEPLTATAVMQLVDAGRVQLDVLVRRYLPELRVADAAAERITVRQLLQHTSGIPSTS